MSARGACSPKPGEHEGVTRQRAAIVLTALTGEHLRLVVSTVQALASLSLDDMRAAATIVRRLKAGARARTHALAAKHDGAVKCETALEVLDARISSVVDLLRAGSIKGLPLPPEVL